MTNITIERTQVKQWLEALKDIDALHHPAEPESADAQKAIADMELALAQPAQEPLEYWNAVEGWVKIDEVREHFASVGCGTIYKTAGEDRVPLYTPPPKRPWVDLTREDILDLFDEHNVYGSKWLEFARAVLAKSKEKNNG